MNGKSAHEVLPFAWERFSLVFFTVDSYLGEALAQLRRRAWSFQYEGVTLTKMKYHCEPCGKPESWYKADGSNPLWM